MRILIISVLFIAFSSCIDPFDTASPEGIRIVTVDGLITTDPGPHLVTLTFANQYTNRSDGNKLPLRDAKVSIIDGEGNETMLQEENIVGERWLCTSGWQLIRERPGMIINLRTGKYYTPESFRAKVGCTYILHIQLSTGEEYESLPQTVLPTPDLENIETRFYSMATENPLIQNVGIEVIGTFSDPQDSKDFYYWNFSNSIIELFTEPWRRGPLSGDPAESINIYYMPDMESFGWFNISDDDDFNRLTTIKLIGRIPDDGIRFKSRYQVQVNLMSVSYDTYQFLRLTKQQLEMQGSVFDPPPANIRGYIKNVGNPNQQALGYFIAAMPSSKVITINRADIPPRYLSTSIIIPGCCIGYCGRLLAPPTILPPAYWEAG